MGRALLQFKSPCTYMAIFTAQMINILQQNVVRCFAAHIKPFRRTWRTGKKHKHVNNTTFEHLHLMCTIANEKNKKNYIQCALDLFCFCFPACHMNGIAMHCSFCYVCSNAECTPFSMDNPTLVLEKISNNIAIATALDYFYSGRLPSS